VEGRRSSHPIIQILATPLQALREPQRGPAKHSRGAPNIFTEKSEAVFSPFS